VTANSRRIAQAVDDETWQEFRLSLKGQSTQDKVFDLIEYYNDNHDGMCEGVANCDFCIRIDNYIKALCRGGQLGAGMTIENLIRRTLDIRK